jgi:hypothetical protein
MGEAHMREAKSAYTVLVGKQGNEPHRIPVCRWRDNIN